MGQSVNVCVVGLGYVGLPVAVAFAKTFPGTLGFDINEEKILDLKQCIDRTGEVSSAELQKCGLNLTSDPAELKSANFYVVAVPTPVDSANIPDLSPVISASKTVARVLKPGDIVVFESTVYPGVTEDICAPVLEEHSGLRAGKDFKLGYSPERINPGDKERTLTRITKVVSGQDEQTLDKVAQVYGAIIEAGVFRASSIRVAEAAKVIENTQRDLNIALVNELALIFDRMKISTSDVLAAAGTKWNFLPFKPGLVGGHCIGVDPYYLTYKAEELGYHPQVITAGRRINDGMGSFIAQKTVKLMLKRGIQTQGARVGICGLTFKENVPDIRNSKVPDIVNELQEYGIVAMVCDPLACPRESVHEYGLALAAESELTDLDVLVLAVPHESFLLERAARIWSKVKPNGVVIDIKSALDKSSVPGSLTYWRL